MFLKPSDRGLAWFRKIRGIRIEMSTIPIVMTTVGDPVRIGLVASLVHPGGNIAGVTLCGSELWDKRCRLDIRFTPLSKGEVIKMSDPVRSLK